MASSEHNPAIIAALQAEVARLTARVAELEAERRDGFADLHMELESLDSERHWLNESLEWYAELYEFAPIAYLALDGAGLIRDINLTGAAMLGRERGRLLGRPMRLHVAPDDRAGFLKHLWRCTREAGQVTSELRILGPSGSFPAQLLSRRSTGGPGGSTLRTAIFDLSERKRAEADLQLSHERLSVALVASEAGLFEYSLPRERLWVSPRWLQIVGNPATAREWSDGLWAWFDERVHPDDRPDRARAHDAFMAGDTPGHFVEFRLRGPKDDEWIWLRERAHAAQRDPAGQPTRVVGVLNDISAEKQRLAESERLSTQLRQLGAALFRVEENERRELATLLHDDLGQRLVAAQLRVAALAQRSASATASGAASDLGSGLEAVAEILNAAQETVRSLSFQLSPPILRDLGLAAGLEWLARELAGTWDLEIDVDDDATTPALTVSAVYLVFRCVRELLINVAKHAGVREAHVVLRAGSEPGSLQVAVEDEGRGFDPAVLAQRVERRSFGLFSVRERIEGLGGHVLVHTAPGRGTQVLLLIPAMTDQALEG